MTSVPSDSCSIRKFSAKELLFLRSDSESDALALDSPEEYLSDLVFSKTAWMEAFTGKLARAQIPGSRFGCAIIRQTNYDEKETSVDKESMMESSLKKETEGDKGIWGRINRSVFVMALWELDAIQAEAAFNTVRKRMALDIKSHISMGLAFFPFMDYSRTHTFSNAVKALDHAAFFGPDSLVTFDHVSLNISGDRLYQLGKITEAIAEYKEGLLIEPDNLNLLNSLGVCYGIINQLDLAQVTFEKAITLYPDEVMSVYNAGLTAKLTGDLEKGSNLLLKASNLNSSIYEVELSLGETLFQRGKYPEAILHLRRAAELRETHSTPLRLLGDLYLKAGEPEKAIPKFNQAIKLNPQDAGALSGLARAFEIQNKNLDIALTFAKESVRINPDNPVFRNRLGNIYLKKNQKPLADEEFEKAKPNRTKTS